MALIAVEINLQSRRFAVQYFHSMARKLNILDDRQQSRSLEITLLRRLFGVDGTFKKTKKEKRRRYSSISCKESDGVQYLFDDEQDRNLNIPDDRQRHRSLKVKLLIKTIVLRRREQEKKKNDDDIRRSIAKLFINQQER